MTHSDVEGLAELASSAAKALFSGDARGYASFIDHAVDRPMTYA